MTWLKFLATLFLLASSNAFGGYKIYLYQSGPNVLASGSGSLNLTALSGVLGTSPVFVVPSNAMLYTGVAGFVDHYPGVVGPTDFGPGGVTFVTTSSGDLVGMAGFASQFFVPTGYVSGNPLSSSATFDATTLTLMGATPGTYVWTWGAGPTADSYTIVVGTPPPAPPVASGVTSVPTLSEWAMVLMSGLLGLAGVAIMRKREQS